MPWDLVKKMRLEGKRPLIRDDLWAEIRGAFWERYSAMFLSPPVELPISEVLPRDLIGKIYEYRQWFILGILQNTGVWIPWVNEVAETFMFVDYPHFPVWGSKWWALYRGDRLANLFQEVFERDWFEHAFQGDEQEAPGFAPKPPLPFADLWSEFYPLFGPLKFLYTASPNQAPYEMIHLRGHATGTDWAATRAAAWASLEPTTGWWWFAANDIGRAGAATWHSYPEGYEVWTDAIVSRTQGKNYSNLWNVRHIDNSPCNPTRQVHAVEYEFGHVGGLRIAVPWAYLISGNGGVGWTTLRSGVCPPDEVRHVAKAVSEDPSHWTDESRLRIDLDADPHEDTPEWPAPTPASQWSWYDQTMRCSLEWGVFNYTEFNWDFKP